MRVERATEQSLCLEPLKVSVPREMGHEGHTLRVFLRAFLAPAEKKNTLGSCGEGLGDKRLLKKTTKANAASLG